MSCHKRTEETIQIHSSREHEESKKKVCKNILFTCLVGAFHILQFSVTIASQITCMLMMLFAKATFDALKSAQQTFHSVNSTTHTHDFLLFSAIFQICSVYNSVVCLQFPFLLEHNNIVLNGIDELNNVMPTNL